MSNFKSVIIENCNIASTMFKMLIRKMSSISLKNKPPLSVFGIEGRYVSALYSAASSKGELEQVEKSLKGILGSLSKPKMIDFLESSMISRSDKSKMMQDFGGAAGFPSCATNFLALVAENGRLKKLRRMINLFLAVMVAHRNEALCEVITAKPLDSSTRDAVISALKKLSKGKNITMTEKVDQSIIGGIVVGVEDKHIDLSIARKIQIYTEIIKEAV